MRKHVLPDGTITIDEAKSYPRSVFAALITGETDAANAYADEQDARFATGVFCPTENEIAKHRRKP